MRKLLDFHNLRYKIQILRVENDTWYLGSIALKWIPRKVGTIRFIEYIATNQKKSRLGRIKEEWSHYLWNLFMRCDPWGHSLIIVLHILLSPNQYILSPNQYILPLIIPPRLSSVIHLHKIIRSVILSYPLPFLPSVCPVCVKFSKP